MFTKVQLQNLLYGYSNSLHYKGVKELLEEYHDKIDIAFNEGLLFRIAINRESLDLLNILLDFYKTTKLSGDPETIEYKLAYYQLKSMLQDAADAHDVPPEIHKVIGPYLAADAENEDEQDLGGFDDIDVLVQSHHILRKSYSESDIIQHHQVASTLLLHSSSESLLSELDSSGSSDIRDSSNLGQGSELFLDS